LLPHELVNSADRLFTLAIWEFDLPIASLEILRVSIPPLQLCFIAMRLVRAYRFTRCLVPDQLIIAFLRWVPVG
jgi:hypothetical protein